MLECKRCGRIVNALWDSTATCSKCGGYFKKITDSKTSFSTDDLKNSLNGIKTKHILIIVGIVFGLIILFGTFYIVPAGERAVLLTFGKPSMNAQGEGLHMKIPLMQTKVIMDVKTQKYEAELTAASRDLQDVATKIAINYRIIAERTPEIYREIGLSYRENVIYPLEQETNKAVTSQYTAEQLITNREEVRGKMKSVLAEKLRERGIIVEEVSIIDFKFSPSFSQAIEAKVTAEQSALAAKNKLEQVKYEAEQQVSAAQGQAEALRLLQESATPSTIELQRLKVQQSAIDKWNGIMPTTLMDSGSGILPTIQLKSI